jgi:hypothetical protein
MLKLYAKPARSDAGDRHEPRPRPPRDDIQCSATLCAGNAFHRCILIDVSRHGCKILVPHQHVPGERVQIALEAYHSLGATIRWYKDGRAGVQFANQLSEFQLVAWKNAVLSARERDLERKQGRKNFWGEAVRA